MKRIIVYILMAGLITLFACEKDETRVYLKSDPAGPVAVSPGDLILSMNDSAKDINIKWRAANFGFDAMINYSVQLDKASNSFNSPVTIATVSSDTMVVINTYNLDNTLRSNNFDTVSTASQLRIMAILKGVGDAYAYADTVYSEPVDLNVKSFEIIINYPKLYVPGDYNGWSFTNTIASVKSNDKYEGYIFIPASGTLKFTSVPAWEQFDTYGDADESGTSGTLVNDWGNNIVVADSGYYKINVDVNALTYHFLNTDWAITGDFNGWSDTPMEYNVEEDIWTITSDLTAGGLKFKLNGDPDWTLDYGDDGADGKLNQGGANISVPSDGNYTVILDLSKPIYTYKLIEN